MESGPRPIQLYSMMICPFAQRTRIHLELLDLPYELTNLDICKPRPEWFLELNPAGQVPVVVRGDDVVSDSSVVSEYLQEIAPTPLPFGQEPAERARQRGFVKFVDGRFVPAMYLLLAARTPEEREQRAKAALETFRWLEGFLATPPSGAPFVNGEFGLPEVVIAPFLLRYEVVRYYQDFALPEDGGFDRVIRWRDAMLALPVVQKTAESIPDLIKLYEDYTIGSYNGAVPEGKERSSLDLAIPPASRPMPERAASVR
ncbi:MAG: glutathione S-transferase family protein [Myxococcota bacterium]|nr:glutathione S-transferase family protein [Myxococcota bacterium]